MADDKIHIDLSQELFFNATMQQVVQIANLAMNRLTMRDWGEIFFEVGINPEIRMKEKGDLDG